MSRLDLIVNSVKRIRRRLSRHCRVLRAQGTSPAALSILTAALAFAGGLTGTYVGSVLEQRNWEKRFSAEYRQKIVERRIALLERTVYLFNKAATTKILRAELKAEVDRYEYCIRVEARPDLANNSGKLLNCAKRDDSINKAERLSKEIHTLNAELASVLSLSSLYFGDGTKSALREITKTDPWLATSPQQLRLQQAMADELGYFPKEN